MVGEVWVIMVLEYSSTALSLQFNDSSDEYAHWAIYKTTQQTNMIDLHAFVNKIMKDYAISHLILFMFSIKS